MSIKPVDVGLMVQRMAEVDRVQQAQDQRAAVAQQQFGQDLRARLEQRESRVKASPDTARPAINPDARREGRGQREGKERERRGHRDLDLEGCGKNQSRGPGRHVDIQL